MANRSTASRSGQDADSRVPRYLRVASVLRRRIRDAHWAVGGRIATLEQLEREFGVARVTVRQSIELLQSEGLLKSLQGRGTFVTKAIENKRWIHLATDWESLVEPIRDNVLELLPASSPAVPQFGEDEGKRAPAYTYIRSVQKRGSEPYAFARVHVAEHVYLRAPKRFTTRPA